MKIEQVREVSAPIDEVWEFFDDIPRVMTCMPGATLTKIVDDQTFEGTLGMKVGPISVNYAGTILLDEKNAETRTVHMTGSGKDKKGAGSAQAKILAQLAASSPSTTTISVSSDVRLTGRVASLGRGVQDVAGKIFEEFARRVSDELTPQQDLASGQVLGAASGTVTERAAAASDSERPTVPSTKASSKVQSNDIKVMPLLWSILKDKVMGWANRLSAKRASRQQGGR